MCRKQIDYRHRYGYCQYRVDAHCCLCFIAASVEAAVLYFAFECQLNFIVYQNR